MRIVKIWHVFCNVSSHSFFGRYGPGPLGPVWKILVCGVCGRTLQGLCEVCVTQYAKFGRSVGSVGLHILSR